MIKTSGVEKAEHRAKHTHRSKRFYKPEIKMIDGCLFPVSMHNERNHCALGGNNNTQKFGEKSSKVLGFAAIVQMAFAMSHLVESTTALILSLIHI